MPFGLRKIVRAGKRIGRGAKTVALRERRGLPRVVKAEGRFLRAFGKTAFTSSPQDLLRGDIRAVKAVSRRIGAAAKVLVRGEVRHRPASPDQRLRKRKLRTRGLEEKFRRPPLSKNARPAPERSAGPRRRNAPSSSRPARPASPPGNRMAELKRQRRDIQDRMTSNLRRIRSLMGGK